MKAFLAFAFATATLLSACTIEQKNGELQSEFHPPLAYGQWQTESYKTQDGQPVCVVSSGYNGIGVLMRSRGDDVGVSVKSNRRLLSGTAFSVNVNGHHYETMQEFFGSKESPRLAEDLAAGGKAYLEWSELRSGHNGRLRSANIVKLDNFAPQFEQCRRSLLKRPSSNEQGESR
jgi:hypothetical protein